MECFKVSAAEMADMNEFFLSQGLEKLIPLGGFIEEVAKESIMGCFEEVIASYAEEYDCFGERAWDILLQAQNIYQSRTNEDGTGNGETDKEEWLNGSRFSVQDFAKWEAGQNIRCGMLIQKEGHFWKNWQLTKKMNRAFEMLSPVQERMMYVMFYIDSNNTELSQFISKMPEFACNKLYVQKEFKEASDNIKKISGNNNKELREFFAEQCRRIRTDKEVF
jgi:hypothetical protein